MERQVTRELLLGPRGLPLMKPPYGRITAIDLNRGEHAWMVPNGDADIGGRDHPAEFVAWSASTVRRAA